MNAYAHLTLAACLIITAAGCDKLPFLPSGKPSGKRASAASASVPVRGTVIAKVNAIPITLEDMNQEIEQYNAVVTADAEKITSREQKVDYVKKQMVNAALLYQEAVDRRLDDSDEVQQALDRTKRQLMVVELLRKGADASEVSSQEVEEYYTTYKNDMKKPEERQIREIVVSSESDAKDILIQLLQGGDFSTLARERSIADSKKDGGNLGFIKIPMEALPAGGKSIDFYKVAFSDSLVQGGVSSIFKVPEGYSIIKLEGKRGGEAVPLSEAFEGIKRYLTILKQRKAIEDIVTKIKDSAKIEIYEGEIK